jgi:poly-gamma-glutamate synthesis protein (capsule biosynthesis protein)
MHPANFGCLRAAQVDACALANNHVLDFGYPGLAETIETLRNAGLRTAGAGADIVQARRPAVIELAGGGSIVAVSVGSTSSGIPRAWGATALMAPSPIVRRVSELHPQKGMRSIGR